MILGQPVNIKPAHGVHLRKEDGAILSAEGETVIASSYWLRRLDSGDIELIAPAKPTKTKE